MEPTLVPGDRVLVDLWTYRQRPPEPGEIVLSPDGRTLYFRNGDQMLAAAIVTQPRLSARRPRMLFEGSYWTFGTGRILRSHDLSPDGETLVFVATSYADRPRRPGVEDQHPDVLICELPLRSD